MQAQQVIITGGGGSLAVAIVDVMRLLQWDVAAPTRLELDVTDVASVNSYFKNRSVNLLICAAGVTADTPLARLSEESWDQIFAINYQGAANCAAAALPTMLRQHLDRPIDMQGLAVTAIGDALAKGR